MAITYYTGIPRSGKTLKAVSLIYETFVAPKIPKTSFLDKAIEKSGLSKEKENIYQVCYTNINQFNFDIDDRIKKLDFDDLMAKLGLLHSMILAKNSDDKNSDAELIEKAREFNLLNALFVIDEAHNFFNKKDDVLTWWLSYHGHIYHDIILITQHLSLILKDYTQFTEYFYKAIPQRFRFSKNTFKYIEYSGRELYKNQKLGVISLKVKPEYFNLYVSGSQKKDKPIIYKYIILLIFLILIALFSFYRFTSSINEINPNEANEPKEIQNLTNTNQENQNNLENKENNISSLNQDNLKLFKFSCFENFCYYKNQNKTIEIPIKFLTPLMLDIDEKNIYIQEQRNKKVNIHILSSEDKFKFLETKTIDKKDDKSSFTNLTN